MDYIQKRQYIKNQAMNKLVKINAGHFGYDRYSSDSYGEQQRYAMSGVIDEMNKNLLSLKNQEKAKNEN